MFQCIVASQQNHIETNWKCEQIDETWLENKVDLSDLTFRIASNGLQHLKALAPLPCPQPLQPSVTKLALSCSKLFAIDGFVRIVMYHMESLSHHITPIKLARNHQKPTISYNIIQYKFIQYLISSYFIWTWKEMTGWKYIRKNLHNVDTWPLLVLERAALGHADLNLDSVHPILAICTFCFVKLFP